MKDYHKQFYFGILAKLQELRDTNGNIFSVEEEVGKPRFKLAYEPRLSEYRHNYLRNGHIAKRDIVITGQIPVETSWGQHVIVLAKKRNTDHVTIYLKAMAALYGDELDEALKELNELLGKFYDIKIEERSSYGRVDLSADNRDGNHMSVYDLS